VNRPRAADDFCGYTCPHGGAAPGTRSGAQHGKRSQVGPADAFQPKCVLVTARDQRGARTGPTIWHGTQLG
jgi:hypothetical protein